MCLLLAGTVKSLQLLSLPAGLGAGVAKSSKGQPVPRVAGRRKGEGAQPHHDHESPTS